MHPVCARYFMLVWEATPSSARPSAAKWWRALAMACGVAHPQALLQQAELVVPEGDYAQLKAVINQIKVSNGLQVGPRPFSLRWGRGGREHGPAPPGALGG
jgi:hypothetical protein